MKKTLTTRILGFCAAGMLTLAMPMAIQADEHEHKDLKDIELDDRTFVNLSGHAHLLATHYGQLAQRSGQANEVRQFGQRLVSDHRQAQERLRAVAREMDITLPVALPEKYAERLQELQQLSGQEFDREFAKDMVKGHRMHVAMYQKAEEKVERDEVKQYLQTTLPTLREHMKAAETMARGVGIDEATLTELAREAAEAVGAPAGPEVGGERQTDDRND
jgi:putative membrane protein